MLKASAIVLLCFACISCGEDLKNASKEMVNDLTSVSEQAAKDAELDILTAEQLKNSDGDLFGRYRPIARPYQPVVRRPAAVYRPYVNGNNVYRPTIFRRWY